MMVVDSDLFGGESREVLEPTGVRVHSDLAWRRDAACQGKPVDLFYPARDDAWQVELALDICATCVVRQECLDWSVENGEDGVWGGTTARDRRHMSTFEPSHPRALPGWMRREIRRQVARGVDHQTIADMFATTRRTVAQIVAERRTNSGEGAWSRRR